MLFKNSTYNTTQAHKNIRRITTKDKDLLGLHDAIILIFMF